jgi:hypothetical protein
MFDVETLGVESNSVILSLACIHFRSDEKPTFRELVDSAFFVKFNVRDQVENYERKVDKGTLEWWGKQCEIVRKKSFLPLKTDENLKNGIESFHSWIQSKNDNKSWVWARGSLDDTLLHSIERQLKVETMLPYHRWRDVRTAVDLLYDSTNGYCKVDHIDFLYERDIIKHDPVIDCALDVMMLLYGKSNEQPTQ